MRKEIKNTIKSAIAFQVNKYLNGTPPSRAAIQYGISTSIMSAVVKGKKDPQITTFFAIARSLGINAAKLMYEIENSLPGNIFYEE